MDWYLGTMGFGYKDWEGVFYPSGSRAREYLSFYSRAFNAAELDTTFYGTPRLESLHGWVSETPSGFRFCAKLPKAITHEMGLVRAETLLAEFLVAMRVMGDRLGAVLIQLPPSFTADSRLVLEAFLRHLPDDIRFACEFRHRSWYTQQTAELLSSHQVCWAATEFPGLPRGATLTTDFLYVRWIGQHGTYERHTHERVDKTAELTWWWQHLLGFEVRVNTIYGFFNNDYAGFAAGTCLKFKQIAGLPVDLPHFPRQQKLF